MWITAPPYTYTVGTNGLSAPQALQYITNQDWFGYRMNFELFAPDDPGWAGLGSPVNNLQTMLVVLGSGGGAEMMQMSNDETARLVRNETRRRVRDALVQLGEFWRSRQ
ncbi:MAG: hypothetical protein U1F36_19700 [Planctomycetota bacterium]